MYCTHDGRQYRKALRIVHKEAERVVYITDWLDVVVFTIAQYVHTTDYEQTQNWAWING